MTKIFKGMFVRGDEIQTIFEGGYGYRSPDFGITWYEMAGEPNSAVDVGFDADDEQNSIIAADGYLYTCSGIIGEILQYEQGSTISGISTRVVVDNLSHIALIGTSQKLYKSNTWGRSVFELLDVPVTDVAIAGNYLTNYELPTISGYELVPIADDEVLGLSTYPISGVFWESLTTKNDIGVSSLPLAWNNETALPFAITANLHFSPIVADIVYMMDEGTNFYKYNLNTKVYTQLTAPNYSGINCSTHLAISPNGLKLSTLTDRDGAPGNNSATRVEVYTIATDTWVASAQTTIDGVLARPNSVVWEDNDILRIWTREISGTVTVKCLKYVISTTTWTEGSNKLTPTVSNVFGAAINSAKTVVYGGHVGASTSFYAKYTIATDTYGTTEVAARIFQSVYDRDKLWYTRSTNGRQGYIDTSNDSQHDDQFVENTDRDFSYFFGVNDGGTKIIAYALNTTPWVMSVVSDTQGIFELEDLPNSVRVDQVTEVRIESWGLNSDDGDIIHTITTHGTKYDAAAITLNSSIGHQAVTSINNPYTGDGWTRAELDDMKIGLKFDTVAGLSKCDKLFVTVWVRYGTEIMGASPTDRTETIDCGDTIINRAHPILDNGTVRVIEIYSDVALSGVKVASFYKTGGSDPPGDGTYSTRNTISLGDVSNGYSKHNVTLVVQSGDFIGMYANSVNGLAADLGFSTNDQVLKSSGGGDQIPCTDETFTPYDVSKKYVASIRATVFI